MPFVPFSLALAKGYMLAALTVCPMPETVPKVNVYFFPKKPAYVIEAPLKALTASAKKDNTGDNFPGDYVVYSLTETKMTGGGVRVGLDGLKDNEGNTCVSVDKVDMVIQYTPTVFIAKELQDFPCHMKAVRDRENNHIAIDRKTVNDFIPKIKMEMLWHLRSLGSQGPYPEAQVEQERQRIIKGISDSTDPVIEKMAKTRNERHIAANSSEDIASACPDERELLAAVVHEGMR